MVLTMERWEGKVAVVTGASSGIGAAIAEKLVEAGLQVAGIARREDKIEELSNNLEGKSGKLHAVKADITNEDEILQAFEWIKENLGPIHILVNSAGVMRAANLANGETQLWKEVFDTNVLGLCIATREAIKDMQANEVDGHIIHINSVLGHTIPNILKMNFNVYPASKFAVTALTETLRTELNSLDNKIKITSVSPGYVQTEFLEASGIEIDGDLAENLPQSLQAEDVADAVVYALSTPPHVQVHELTIQAVGATA